MRGLRTPRRASGGRWSRASNDRSLFGTPVRRLPAATALLVAPLAALLVAPLAAQEVTDVTLGIGVGFSSIGEDYLSIGGKRDLVVGVDFGLPVSGALALRPGLSYTNKGSKRYLQVSLPVARHRVVNRGRLFLDMEAGPWFAVRTGSSNAGTPRCHIEDTDLGLGGGLGVSYGITDGVALHIDTTYHMGFTDVTTCSPSTVVSEVIIETVRRTRILALQVGVVFRI